MYKLTEEFVWKEIGNQVVILAFESGDYWTLNDTASAIWRQLIEGESIESAANALVAEYDIEFDAALTDVKDLVNDCLSKKVLVLS